MPRRRSDQLKSYSKEHKKKKAKTFSTDEIEKFVIGADDSKFLTHKLVLLIGVFGGMRVCEFIGLNFEHVKLLTDADGGSSIQVVIARSKTDPAGEGHSFLMTPHRNPACCPDVFSGALKKIEGRRDRSGSRSSKMFRRRLHNFMARATSGNLRATRSVGLQRRC